jgi:hypothetical protein
MAVYEGQPFEDSEETWRDRVRSVTTRAARLLDDELPDEDVEPG